jgi:hypothetical protein
MKKYLREDHINEFLDFRDTSDGFLVYTILLDEIKQVNTRKYVKLQEVLANICGFVKGLILIITFLTQGYFNASYYFDLAKRCLLYEEF